jgi:hypothetical protein
MAKLVQKDAQKDQEEENQDLQSAGGATLGSIERGKHGQQEEESGMYSDLDPTNTRNFKRPSHFLISNAPRRALGFCPQNSVRYGNHPEAQSDSKFLSQ